jgi:DNA-binding transcriptional LysR family regulator
MELNQLRTFIAIAREGNLTRASGSLFLSQPAVTAQLKALEDELNIKLFKRTPKGMILTQPGELLLEEANKALDAAQSLMNRARSFHEGVIGELRLGTISEPVTLRLGEFLSKFLTLYPNAKIHSSQHVSGEVVERVIADELDAGYVIGDISMPGLSVLRLAPISIRVVAPVKWKKKLEHSSWPDLAKFPWIGTPPKCSFTHIAKRVFSEHNAYPLKIIETDQECVLRHLVAGGVGLGFLREDQAMAAETAGEIYVWTGDSVQSHLQFVYKSGDGGSPLLRAMVALVHEIWGV